MLSCVDMRLITNSFYVGHRSGWPFLSLYNHAMCDFLFLLFLNFHTCFIYQYNAGYGLAVCTVYAVVRKYSCGWGPNAKDAKAAKAYRPQGCRCTSPFDSDCSCERDQAVKLSWFILLLRFFDTEFVSYYKA